MADGKKRGRDAGGGGKPWRKKQYHESELCAGMRGVLITCDVHAEKVAVREAFSALSLAWDQLQPQAGE
jgi:hypothetical protein